MEKKNLMPQQAQPIERITTGQLPDVLAELSEEALQHQGEAHSASYVSVLASGIIFGPPADTWHIGPCITDKSQCSYDGDDAQ